jgi:predicted nucleotidyltransferase
MADEATIERAAQRLLHAARPPARVILFGSHARGGAAADSDLDFLVIEQVVDSRIEETARLRNALGEVGAPVDILLYSEQQVSEWGDVQNTALFEALREGRLIGET